MEQFFLSLMIPSILINALVIGLIIHYFRTTVMNIPRIKWLETKKLYRDVLLPVLPIIISVLLHKYNGLDYYSCIISGFISSYAYRMFKSFLTKQENSLKKSITNQTNSTVADQKPSEPKQD